MRIFIIFPKEFFSKSQLDRLNKYDLEFLEGNKVDLVNFDKLYSEEEYIIAPDPSFLKDDWDTVHTLDFSKMKGLKAFCLTTTSFSWIDLKKMKELGVIVTNTPGKSTNAVAEFNIFMMQYLLRQIPLIAQNDWKMDYANFLGEEATGLKAGIIGLGQIGQRTAELCKGLDMEVSFWNRSEKDVPYTFLELDELFKTSDVIFNTIATPPEVKGMVKNTMIDSMKSSAVIVASSGPIYDEEYVLELVENAKLGGYATESIKKSGQVYEGNVVYFPENGYYTRGTLENTARILTDTITSVIEGEPMNRVG